MHSHFGHLQLVQSHGQVLQVVELIGVLRKLLVLKELGKVTVPKNSFCRGKLQVTKAFLFCGPSFSLLGKCIFGQTRGRNNITTTLTLLKLHWYPADFQKTILSLYSRKLLSNRRGTRSRWLIQPERRRWSPRR